MADKTKTTVRISKASALGFCFGVRRAIKMLQEAAGEHKSISTLGPVVHNKKVINDLSRLGVNVVNNIDEVKGTVITIPSHGMPPEILKDIEQRGLVTFDTTCPNVRSAQKTAKKLSDDGFYVIIFGDEDHREVKGLLGWAGDKATATLDVEKLDDLIIGKRVGILSQTTQTQLQFQDFIQKFTSRFLPKLQELRIANTLCHETRKRQDAALSLAGKSDLLLVVGGLNSANSRHLAEMCSPLVDTYLIESAADIKQSWLKGKKRIGITAGASTPDEAIKEVISYLDSKLK